MRIVIIEFITRSHPPGLRQLDIRPGEPNTIPENQVRQHNPKCNLIIIALRSACPKLDDWVYEYGGTLAAGDM